jgi:hypothetical protein
MRLGDRPFLGQEAVQRGELTARRLQKDHVAIYRNAYVSKHTTVDALTRARAAWLWARGDCVLVGLSAAAALGTKWIDADMPAEICRRIDTHRGASSFTRMNFPQTNFTPSTGCE